MRTLVSSLILHGWERILVKSDFSKAIGYFRKPKVPIAVRRNLKLTFSNEMWDSFSIAFKLKQFINCNAISSAYFTPSAPCE